MENTYKSISNIFLILILLVLSSHSLSASEVKVSNITISEINKEKKYAYIQFNVEWKNSWRYDVPGNTGYKEPVNRDAVWIFIKFSKSNTWYHAELSQINQQHSIPAEAEIETANDGKGVFLFRKDNGEGDVSYTDVKLKWNFASNNIEIDNSLPVKVFALEMVYIPQGPFYAGDNKSTGTFFDKESKEPVLISEVSSVIKTSRNHFDDEEILDKGIIINGVDGISTQSNNFYNSEYPTGYKAFYMMKYEISQQEYTNFLNTISIKQSNKRALNEYGRYNNFIKKNNKSFECNKGNIACNYLSWYDGTAFADWAGLRPMTELEYEKAGRGFNKIENTPNKPVKGEYAWNNIVIYRTDIKKLYSTSLIQVKGNACFEYSTVDDERFLGPLITGVYEYKNKKSRTELGASYYGVMELSGNLTELCVTIGNTAGRSYTGLNGDGNLNDDGDADVTCWPGINGNEDDSYPNLEYLGNAITSPGVTGSAGAGQRGGNWNQAKELLTISNRTFAARRPKDRNNQYGFRCVRSADEN